MSVEKVPWWIQDISEVDLEFNEVDRLPQDTEIENFYCVQDVTDHPLGSHSRTWLTDGCLAYQIIRSHLTQWWKLDAFLLVLIWHPNWATSYKVKKLRWGIFPAFNIIDICHILVNNVVRMVWRTYDYYIFMLSFYLFTEKATVRRYVLSVEKKSSILTADISAMAWM